MNLEQLKEVGEIINGMGTQAVLGVSLYFVTKLLIAMIICITLIFVVKMIIQTVLQCMSPGREWEAIRDMLGIGASGGITDNERAEVFRKIGRLIGKKEI